MTYKFEPEYKTFFERTFNRIIAPTIVFLLFDIFSFYEDSAPYLITIIFTIVLVAFLYSPVKGGVIYLKSVTLTNEKIILEVVKFDKQYKIIDLDIRQSNIRIYDDLLSSPRVTKRFKFIVDTKNDNGKFYTVFKQSERGNWNLDLFKSVYIKYCEITKISFRCFINKMNIIA